MKKRLMIIVGPILVLVLGGCATPDQRVAQLQTENQSLMNQTKEQEQQIATLTIDKQYLTTVVRRGYKKNERHNFNMMWNVSY